MPVEAQHRPGPWASLPTVGRGLKQDGTPRDHPGALVGMPAFGVKASPSPWPFPLVPPPSAQGRPPFSRLVSRSADAAPSPPPCSCWEWRLHFSCHLHSQSIRTLQLSRLAELRGRRRRERVLWGLSPPHRSHSAPDCFLLRRAQPAGRGGSGNPRSSFSLLGTRGARRARAGGPCWPNLASLSPGALRPRGGEWAGAGPLRRRGSHVQAAGSAALHGPPR